MRGSPDKYKSYMTTHLFLDDLNQSRGKNICFQDCNFPDDTILLHGAIPWERAFLWLLNWKSCRNAISGIYLLWSQAHMESRQTDQIQFVVLRHSEKSLLHSPFPVSQVLSEVEKLSMKIKSEHHDLIRQPDFHAINMFLPLAKMLFWEFSFFVFICWCF